jgi:Putative Flp pilus-assembly TadE/G-like
MHQHPTENCRPTAKDDRLRMPRSEDGFVAVATALLSVVLIVFCALAIDVAVFLVRAQQLQRTADAAALSAVVKMPRFPAAEALAKEIGAKNRIAPEMITVEQIPGKDRDLRVTVRDPHVSTFFGKLFRKDISIERSARSQYVAQVELGSKLNALGTGNLPGLGRVIPKNSGWPSTATAHQKKMAIALLLPLKAPKHRHPRGVESRRLGLLIQ